MKSERNYIKDDIIISSKDSILTYLDELKNRDINSVDDLNKWWKDKSETDAFLEEDMAWRYIKMSCDTTDKELSDSFNFFVTEIEPVVSLDKEMAK